MLSEIIYNLRGYHFYPFEWIGLQKQIMLSQHREGYIGKVGFIIMCHVSKENNRCHKTGGVRQGVICLNCPDDEKYFIQEDYVLFCP